MTAEPCTSFRSRGPGVGVLTCRCPPSRIGCPVVFKHFHRLPVSSSGEDAMPCLRFLRWLLSPSAVGTPTCKTAGKAREATVQGGQQEDPKRCPLLPLHVGRPLGAGRQKAIVLEDRKGRGLPQPIPSHPVGSKPPSCGLQISALHGEGWRRKGDGLAKFCRRLMTDPLGPEPVGTSTFIGADIGLVGRGRQVAGCPVSP